MADLQRPIFEVEDPRGYKIVCTREQWIFHVVSNRKFMDSEWWIDQARDTIRQPLEIYHDADYPDRENYYRLLPPRTGRNDRRRYMKVVVVIDGEHKTGKDSPAD